MPAGHLGEQGPHLLRAVDVVGEEDGAAHLAGLGTASQCPHAGVVGGFPGEADDQPLADEVSDLLDT